MITAKGRTGRKTPSLAFGKKSQVAVFVALGMILLLLAISLFMLISWDIEPNMPDSEESVRQYMRLCMQSEAESLVRRSGLYTGRTIAPAQARIPNSTEVAENLKAEVQEIAERCVKTYPRKADLGVLAPEAQVIVSDKVLFTIENAYSYTWQGIVKESGLLSLQVDARYETMLRTAKQIIAERTEYIPDSPALKTEGLTIEAGRYSEGELWLMTDEYSDVRGGPFYFAFVIAR